MALGAVLVLSGAACTSEPAPAGPVPTTVTTTTSESTPDQIVIGVDTVSGGYNPHALADMSTTTRALAQLVLPSVFRPGDDGRPELDKTLMKSAKVVSSDPFTVAYTIRPDASWSDGAPIAAEDFSYLAGAMRTQPGTVDPAGYRLIDNVVSREGGKSVEVEFSERYPGWRSLFSDLLPAHLLKDVPGGWRSALSSSFPAYGGPFSIKSADTARGEILLERNERYWAKPAAVDQLVLRRSDQNGLAEALRNANNQFALTSTDAAGLRALEDLGSLVDLHTVYRPDVAEVLLRPTSDVLSDDGVRAAIAAMIDRAKLIETGTGGGPSSKLRANAQVFAPSEREYAPTMPARWEDPDLARAERLLSAAGYVKTGGDWQGPDGKPLQLVIASPGKGKPYQDIADELARQLTDAGVAARAKTPNARELLAVDPAEPGRESTGNGVHADIVVGPRAVGPDPAATFASRFSCRKTEATDTRGSGVEPGNVAGFCDKKLQHTIDAMLTGEKELAESLATIEPQLWQVNVSIPLFQLADTLALTDDVAGVSAGPPLAGPFGSAVNWIRTGE